VGLEEGDDAPAGEANARGFEVRADLGRMVSVAIDDGDAAGLADGLEAAFRSLELPEWCGDVRAGETKNLPDGDSGKRIADVMDTRQMRFYFPPEVFSVFYHKS
jgi:hypothetical protein